MLDRISPYSGAQVFDISALLFRKQMQSQTKRDDSFRQMTPSLREIGIIVAPSTLSAVVIMQKFTGQLDSYIAASKENSLVVDEAYLQDAVEMTNEAMGTILFTKTVESTPDPLAKIAEIQIYMGSADDNTSLENYARFTDPIQAVLKRGLRDEDVGRIVHQELERIRQDKEYLGPVRHAIDVSMGLYNFLYPHAQSYQNRTLSDIWR